MRDVVSGLWSEKLLHVAETITLKEEAINKGVIKPGTDFGLKQSSLPFLIVFFLPG